MRKLILLVDIDESYPINENMGTIDYVEREFGWLGDSGIYLDTAKIVDEDDDYDKEIISAIEKYL